MRGLAALWENAPEHFAPSLRAEIDRIVAEAGGLGEEPPLILVEGVLPFSNLSPHAADELSGEPPM